MKKVINDPADVVVESLRGFAAAHADLVRAAFAPDFVVRADDPVTGQVALVSGGGSGHEPLHVGFVGAGMLAAAVPGPVFTSPTPDAILAAARAVDAGAGVLFVVKNYTGDVLNFETGAEFAAAAGLDVRTVLVDDDVAVRDSTWTAGRRGVAGTVAVEKVAGAAAARGDRLDDVLALAQRAVANVRSMGVALTGCTVPQSGRPSFVLADDEVEIGIGIHGEPGRARVPLRRADDLVAELLAPIVEDLPFAGGDRTLLFVNGMGGTPLSELYLAFGAAHAQLSARGIEVSRALVGNYVTSLEMQGFSITLLRLDDELTELWDAPVHTAALRW